MPVISAFERLRREDLEFQGSLGYIDSVKKRKKERREGKRKEGKRREGKEGVKEDGNLYNTIVFSSPYDVVPK
jgi:hypothetical protein